MILGIHRISAFPPILQSLFIYVAIAAAALLCDICMRRVVTIECKNQGNSLYAGLLNITTVVGWVLVAWGGERRGAT